VVNSDNAARTLNLGTGSYTYTINGILGVNTNKAIIAAGTGGTVVIGSERNLAINMDNTGGVDINAPIVNNGGGASAVTIASTIPSGTPGTVTLGGANTYSGATTITRGTLNLANVLALQNTSGLTLGGTTGATLSSTLTGITISAPITTADSGVTSTIAFGRATSAIGSITLNGAIGGNGNVTFTTPAGANSGSNTQTINLGAAGTYLGNTTLNAGQQGTTVLLRNSTGAANALPTSTVLSFGTGIGDGSGRSTTFDLNGRDQTLAGLTTRARCRFPGANG
jgi:autotransporter-associated beta strand protein